MRMLTNLDYFEQTGHGILDFIEVNGKDFFEINEYYINVVLPFDEEVMHSKNENLNNNVGVNVGVKLNKTQALVYKLIRNNHYKIT